MTLWCACKIASLKISHAILMNAFTLVFIYTRSVVLRYTEMLHTTKLDAMIIQTQFDLHGVKTTERRSTL